MPTRLPIQELALLDIQRSRGLVGPSEHLGKSLEVEKRLVLQGERGVEVDLLAHRMPGREGRPPPVALSARR